jgi:hypothetical protein
MYIQNTCDIFIHGNLCFKRTSGTENRGKHIVFDARIETVATREKRNIFEFERHYWIKALHLYHLLSKLVDCSIILNVKYSKNL